MEQSTGLYYNLGQNQLLSMYMNMDNQNKLEIMMLQQQIKEMESQMNEMRTKIINQDKTKGNEENVNSEFLRYYYNKRKSNYNQENKKTK